MFSGAFFLYPLQSHVPFKIKRFLVLLLVTLPTALVPNNQSKTINSDTYVIHIETHIFVWWEVSSGWATAQSTQFFSSDPQNWHFFIQKQFLLSFWFYFFLPNSFFICANPLYIICRILFNVSQSIFRAPLGAVEIIRMVFRRALSRTNKVCCLFLPL